MIILVVEDEPVTAVALEADLKEAGHGVLGPAATANEGLQLAERARPDLALIDMDLKDGSNGVDLARLLLRRWNTPVLLITGYPERARASNDVAIGLIPKPFLRETVLAGILIAKAVAMNEPMPLSGVPNGLELFSKPSGGR